METGTVLFEITKPPTPGCEVRLDVVQVLCVLKVVSVCFSCVHDPAVWTELFFSLQMSSLQQEAKSSATQTPAALSGTSSPQPFYSCGRLEPRKLTYSVVEVH